MAKVKDYKNWKKVIFKDRAILKCDLVYMSKTQVEMLENLDVIADEENGKTLIAENR